MLVCCLFRVEWFRGTHATECIAVPINQKRAHVERNKLSARKQNEALLSDRNSSQKVSQRQPESKMNILQACHIDNHSN